MSEGPLLEIGIRMKTFREQHLKLTQAQVAAKLDGTPAGLQKNELGLTLPNSKVLVGLGALGANLNWLLRGEGPMLLADTQKPAPGKINVEALLKAFEVMTQTAEPGEMPRQTARKAVEFYMYLIETGKITPEGLGPNHLSNAA
jgi:hypothetical protein